MEFSDFFGQEAIHRLDEVFLLANTGFVACGRIAMLFAIQPKR